MQRKNCRTKKKILISLTFNETTAWVASRVYVHIQKTAKPRTNVHCSILQFSLQSKCKSAFVPTMMNKRIPPKL